MGLLTTVLCPLHDDHDSGGRAGDGGRSSFLLQHTATKPWVVFCWTVGLLFYPPSLPHRRQHIYFPFSTGCPLMEEGWLITAYEGGPLLRSGLASSQHKYFDDSASTVARGEAIIHQYWYIQGGIRSSLWELTLSPVGDHFAVVTWNHKSMDYYPWLSSKTRCSLKEQPDPSCNT